MIDESRSSIRRRRRRRRRQRQQRQQRQRQQLQHPAARRQRRRPACDAGSAAVELVILTPVLVVLMLFVVFVGRASGAVEQVRHAADEGARAASLVSQASMSAAAGQAVLRDLRTNGTTCASTDVVVSISASTAAMPGGPVGVGSVTVTVTCVVDTAGTELLGTAARTVSASSTEVIDRYRAG